MKIIIIGAGIAGLSAGIALRRAGHTVILLEQSSLLHEVGAAISIAPNASPALKSWGFDVYKARMVTIERISMLDGATMKTIFPNYVINVERDYGTPMYAVHRVDLHNQLRDIALDKSGPGVPCELHTRAKVASYDIENASVTLTDGNIWQGDLLIAADGVHSMATDYILTEDEMKSANTGWTCMRWLVPTDELLADPATAPFVENDSIRLIRGRQGGSLIWYPCRDSTLNNFAYFSKELAASAMSEGDHAVLEADVLKTCASDDFGPELQAIIAKVGEVRYWKLIAREPSPRWHKGRLLMIGDAAHPMLPFQAQGGNQAIEDAAALGVLLEGVEDHDVVKDRLIILEQLRQKRASALQLLSSSAPPLSDEVCKDLARFLPDGVDPRNREDVTRFIFGFDILAASRAAISGV